MKIHVFILTASLSFWANKAIASDSLRVENINGKALMIYKVEPGQTLFAIARKYRVQVSEIKALNPGLNQLKAGAEIFLPTKSITITSAETVAAPAEIPSRPAPAVHGGTDETIGTLTHEVKPGESLYKIARQYNVTVAEINKLNNLGKSGLKSGQQLLIPGGERSEQAETQTTSSRQSTGATTSSQEAGTTTVVAKTEKRASATGYPSVIESGVAQLDETMAGEPFYEVQHKTAPVGTLIFIKHKENGHTIHAKVVSALKTSTSNVILNVNKKVFEKLAAGSKSFAVEISYTPEQ